MAHLVQFIYPMPPSTPHPSWFRPYRSLNPRQPAPVVIPQPAPIALSAPEIYARRRKESHHEES